MRQSVLRVVACPACDGDLAIGRVDRTEDEQVISGALQCGVCHAEYPIVRGVPRLIPGQVHADATTTAARFGVQWKTFSHMSDYQERWLRGWLAPLGPDDFRGKTVFEGGCGKGRHTMVAAAQWGVKDIVALDLGDSVDVAFEHTRHLPNVHVVQGDLLRPPIKRGVFDIGFSVGVLHHLPDPRAGFESVRAAVRPGGKVAVWVYGAENNEWITRYVDPVRQRVTSRMPAPLLYWLTLPPSAGLAAAARIWPGSLPYADYMRQLGTIPLREVHNIVFDQLVTPLAYYLPEQEVRSWFEQPGLTDVVIGWHNRNSWRGCATVTATT